MFAQLNKEFIIIVPGKVLVDGSPRSDETHWECAGGDCNV